MSLAMGLHGALLMTVNHVVHANLASQKKKPNSQSRRLRIPPCRCYSSGSDLSQYLTLNLTVAVAQRPCSGDRTRGGRVFMLSFFFWPFFFFLQASFSSAPPRIFFLARCCAVQNLGRAVDLFLFRPFHNILFAFTHNCTGCLLLA